MRDLKLIICQSSKVELAFHPSKKEEVPFPTYPPSKGLLWVVYDFIDRFASRPVIPIVVRVRSRVVLPITGVVWKRQKVSILSMKGIVRVM